ncbi:MAG: peptide ABC transporter substrate-binding protein [Candidatus Lambdaproteobacteria bacterium]|nr:peptide ABC transporter substrate-binding protein [Candidatus Lambdaproteobacteria bacterium]
MKKDAARPWFILLLAAALLQATPAIAQKYGGLLNWLLEDSPPSLSIHENATIVVTGPMMPVYNNVVLFDQLQARESFESIVPELAESWRWNDGGKLLIFKLRQGIRFHDGKPFTGRDVKHTFDVVRGASRTTLKASPRKLWYANVAEIATSGDHEVTFRLKRPQPSLLAMLASGYSPVYPAHVAPAELRTRAMGTGPFRFEEYVRDRYIHVARNSEYWVRGRPYLDAIRSHIVNKKAARFAALASMQVDVDGPAITTKPDMEALKRMAPGLSFRPTTRTSFTNVVFNTKRAPFDNSRLRQAVSMALERPGFIKSVFQGGMVPGGINMPPPDGIWGLAQEMLVMLPGYGDIQRDRQEARKIMTSLGYTEDSPLRVTLNTRTSPVYVDAAVWTASELKQIWIAAEVKQLESSLWFNTLNKRDFTIALNSTGFGVDDPDVALFENYACGSLRNYSDYCNPLLEKLFEQQSMTADMARRQQMVWYIENVLLNDVARVVYGFRINYNAMWPYVRNLVPHQTNFSYSRMQEVWLDK